MDLFDDLPEPGKERDSPPSAPETASLSWGTAGAVDFFSDLPPARGVKRKLEEKNSTDTMGEGTSEAVCGVIKGFSAEKKGEREEMQDFHVVLDDFRKQVPDLHPSIGRLSYYAVFDGHGGARASKFAASNLHQQLSLRLPKVPLPQIERDMKRTMTEVFKKTDEEFLKLATKTKPSWKDGTTAIVVLVLQNVLYISNLGDSKAILCRRRGGEHFAVPLSTDHSPQDYEERMRVQKAGGHVREGRVMGVLEVSRSIGDGQYKALGVTPIPDVRRCRLTEDDVFVLLACDGLWKVLSSEEVINTVLSSRKDSTSTEICYETACNRLVNEAIRRYSGDNVTVVIASIERHT